MIFKNNEPLYKRHQRGQTNGSSWPPRRVVKHSYLVVEYIYACQNANRYPATII
ncbi:hypothetical protein HanXRQr2_Chr03g0090181 [Helianthus annuus]|uniref:Uncharacterized protein n=1 Tax=Helianthus annuus TaxID=4232 RepID=A0A9K3JC15_HELAN|nr:hypothetical protein HanXRQr2_Chr03g0090181 [Helianthus annuus]